MGKCHPGLLKLERPSRERWIWSNAETSRVRAAHTWITPGAADPQKISLPQTAQSSTERPGEETQPEQLLTNAVYNMQSKRNRYGPQNSCVPP